MSAPGRRWHVCSTPGRSQWPWTPFIVVQIFEMGRILLATTDMLGISGKQPANGSPAPRDGWLPEGMIYQGLNYPRWRIS